VAKGKTFTIHPDDRAHRILQVLEENPIGLGRNEVESMSGVSFRSDAAPLMGLLRVGYISHELRGGYLITPKGSEALGRLNRGEFVRGLGEGEWEDYFSSRTW